jgi:hypothetical protein
MQDLFDVNVWGVARVLQSGKIRYGYLAVSYLLILLMRLHAPSDV